MSSCTGIRLIYCIPVEGRRQDRRRDQCPRPQHGRHRRYSGRSVGVHCLDKARILKTLLSGSDNTSTTLIIAMYFLICNPALYRRLQQEVDQKLAGNGGDAPHKMLASIPLLDAVIQEVSDRVLSPKRSSVAKIPYRRFVSGRPTTCLAPSHPVGHLSQAS